MCADPKIKVLVVDDHPLVLQGLVVLLENFSHFELVGTASSGEIALTLCYEHQPDVILMDLLMPGMGGLEAMRTIIALYSQIKIIVLTSELDKQILQRVLQAGATSYLLKEGSVNEVAEAIRHAYQGQSMLSPSVIETLISLHQGTIINPYELSPREREVLALLIRGYTTAQIAENLFISKFTVKDHLINLFSKLGVDNRASAVAVALHNHVLEEK